jgi:hypothetical protein
VSDTPRTDAAQVFESEQSYDLCDAAAMKQLEREFTTLRAENERLRTAMIWYIVNCDEEPSEEALQAIAPLAQGTYWITIERTEAARAFLARNAEKEER